MLTVGEQNSVEYPEVKTVADFLAIVGDKEFEKFAQKPQMGEEVLCYRGQANISYDLEPSIVRTVGPDFSVNVPDNLQSTYKDKENRILNLLSQERKLISFAKTKMPDIFRDDMSPIELLAAMQHYGLPTRLLDVTDNPLVALYFSCCEGIGEYDGHVVVFKRRIYDSTVFPVKNALADISRFMVLPSFPIIQFYREISDQPYFVTQRQRDLENYGSEDEIIEYVRRCCEDQLIFVYPPNRNMRQIRQQGGFILFPNKISRPDDEVINDLDSQWRFERHIEPIPPNHHQICVHVRIPRNSKKEILRELALMGMSKKEVYSDSPDTVCEEIKNDVFDMDFLARHHSGKM